MNFSNTLKNSPGMNYIGCKNAMANKIIAIGGYHDVYVEPFLGSGAVFLKKKLAKFSILGDLNKIVYSYHKVVSDKIKKDIIIEELDKMIFDENILKAMSANEKDCLQNLAQVMKF